MATRPKHPATIDAYIAQQPAAAQLLLRQLRAIVHAAAPKAEEKISYGMPAFAQDGNLVWFGAFARHIGFYPRLTGLPAFEKAQAPYAGTKSSLHFPLDQPLPAALITRLVKYRLAENKAKAKAAK